MAEDFNSTEAMQIYVQKADAVFVDEKKSEPTNCPFMI